MIPYLFERLGVGLSQAYTAYNQLILGFGRKEWGLVLAAFAVFGALCMRGKKNRF